MRIARNFPLHKTRVADILDGRGFCFFDCFEDYERCVSSVKDSNGRQFYNVPNLKGKLHTYMSAQRLNSKQRSRLGSGDWLFDDSRFWNLNIVELQPLKDYFRANLK